MLAPGSILGRIGHFCMKSYIATRNMLFRIRIRIRMSFIARYVYTYEEFVFVTEAPQYNRMTATEHKTHNKRIKNTNM